MRRYVRTASLTGYADLARSLGLDPARLMAGVGLDLADLAVPDRWVPAAPVARLLEISARESGREDFAVRLSEVRRLGNLGPLSVVLREEPDLRGALELLIRYADLFTGVLDLRLTEAEGRVTAAIWMEFGRPVPVRQALDLVAANLIGIIRMLVRRDWEPLCASFAHRAPADLAAFHRVFGPRLHFEQEFTGLVFDRRELDAPVVTSDASVRPYAQQFLDTIVPSPAATTAVQAGAAVELLLPVGRSSLDDVSRRLGLRPRLLQRQLAEEGQSFSAVVHATRARLAERYLANDRYSLTEVSQLLGFAAPSAFSRWFRQQFGRTPSAWRAAARGRTEPAPGDGRPPLRQEPRRPSSAAGTPSRPA